MCRITDEIDTITGRHHFGTVAWQRQFTIADDGKNGHRQIRKQIGQVTDRRVEDRAFIGTLHTDKIHPASTHILDVECARNPDLVADRGGHLGLGRDDMVNRQLIR